MALSSSQKKRMKPTERNVRPLRELPLVLDKEMKSLSRRTSEWQYDPEQLQPEWPRDAPFGWGYIGNPFADMEGREGTSTIVSPKPRVHFEELGSFYKYTERKIALDEKLGARANGSFDWEAQ